MTDSEIIEQLIEAQRGLMGALAQITAAIEELNCQRPAALERGTRNETANVAIAKAIEHNTDFLRYARRSGDELLERISPTDGFTF
jgi:hypothetical protein